jgi:hypothetical protein
MPRCESKFRGCDQKRLARIVGVCAFDLDVHRLAVITYGLKVVICHFVITGHPVDALGVEPGNAQTIAFSLIHGFLATMSEPTSLGFQLFPVQTAFSPAVTTAEAAIATSAATAPTTGRFVRLQASVTSVDYRELPGF